MLWLCKCMWPRHVLAVLALCVLVPLQWASAQGAGFSALLDRTEAVRTRNHPQFLLQLEQLSRNASDMSAWRLRPCLRAQKCKASDISGER